MQSTESALELKSTNHQVMNRVLDEFFKQSTKRYLEMETSSKHQTDAVYYRIKSE